MIDGSRCPACGRASVPAEPRCLGCRAATEPDSFDPAGRVLARTRTASEADWVVLVELDGGARVIATSPSEPNVGARAALEVTPQGLRLAADA